MISFALQLLYALEKEQRSKFERRLVGLGVSSEEKISALAEEQTPATLAHELNRNSQKKHFTVLCSTVLMVLLSNEGSYNICVTLVCKMQDAVL
jgi:hypothetical protein